MADIPSQGERQAQEFVLVTEPRAAAYEQLVDFGSRLCPAFSLVLHHRNPLDAVARIVLARLDPHLVSSDDVREWPGTELWFGYTATLHRYRLNADSATVLREAAGALYDWQHPALPEDLCLYRQDGSAWLVTVAHEADASVFLRPDEYEAVRVGAPELAACLE
jgi:hypothetical protein